MGIKVLIVDDSAAVCQVLEVLLGSLFRGASRIEIAHDGSCALDLLGKDVYDVVFLDYDMPGPDGLEVLAQIRRSGFATDVYMITACEPTQISWDAATGGAKGFFRKPFDYQELESVMSFYSGAA